jgi:hypothetical protein
LGAADNMQVEGDKEKEKPVIIDFNGSKITERAAILGTLQEAITYLQHKGLKGRMVSEKEKTRIQYIRALIYAISVYNKILQDKELDQLRDEVETLKSHMKKLK